MVSIGDTMDYHLVRPDYDAGQDYKFSLKKTYRQRTTSNSSQKKIEKFRGLTKTIPLAHGSLYIHTAHDDEMYYHSLDFAKQSTTKNRVRVVLVFRWLSVPTFFRQNPQDNRCNRFSTIDKHAFESMDDRKKASLWWKAMGYIDQQGNNIITPLMDPIIPKDERKKVKTNK